MVLTRRNPEQAFEKASAWQGLGGGEAAKHCVAVALIGMGKYQDAATRLEKLAEESKQSAGIRAEMLAQAGQAWFLVGENNRAHNAQTSALKLTPKNREILVDRAVTLGTINNHQAAIDDLTLAIAIAPNHPDAYVYRASSLRFLDKLDQAMADAEAALVLTSNSHPEALLERGMLRRLKGDNKGARQDWLRVIEFVPETPTADAARRNIELLEIKQ
jgi:tetratricopeptide (TPR) repeat protein